MMMLGNHPHHHSGSSGTGSNTRLRDHDGLAVFTWGRGEDGQLGLGDTSDQDEPTYVSLDRSNWQRNNIY